MGHIKIAREGFSESSATRWCSAKDQAVERAGPIRVVVIGEDVVFVVNAVVGPIVVASGRSRGAIVAPTIALVRMDARIVVELNVTLFPGQCFLLCQGWSLSDIRFSTIENA